MNLSEKREQIVKSSVVAGVVFIIVCLAALGVWGIDSDGDSVPDSSIQSETVGSVGVHVSVTETEDEVAAYGLYVDGVFVAACDMPGIDADFIKELFRYAEGEWRIVLPRHDGILEPLCGLYHKDCFSVAGRMLSENRNCILEMYDVMPVRYVMTKNCFFNVNYPSDVDGIGRRTKNNSCRFKRRLVDFCSEKGLNV